jgi:DNA polymerase elongation subunit (family B)
MWDNPVMKIPKKNLTYQKKKEVEQLYGDDAIHESDVPIETRVLTDLYDNEEISDGHRRFFYDIEVSSEGGFPNVKQADKKITSFAYYDEARDKRAVLILDEDSELEDPGQGEVDVIPLDTEYKLLETILKHWREADPTIIVGWNNDLFDNPYLYRRLKKVLGEDSANKLSPIEKVGTKKVNREETVDFGGISSLDYMRIYRNFTFTEQPSYSLDAISSSELDRGKVEYEGLEVNGEVIKDLDDLKRLDPKRFIKYNMEDVDLIVDIDEKLNFIEMARRIAHLGHVPYEDVYMSSRFIEGAILNRLHETNVVAPDNERGKTTFKVEGRHRLGSNEIQVGKEISDDIPRQGTIGVEKASTKTKREKVDYTRIEDDTFILENPMDFEAEDGAEVGLEFAGAYVKEPDAGIYEWIFDLDLTSMYPCIIMGLNVSPETKIAKIYDWNVKDFARKPDGKEYDVWVFDQSDYKHFSSVESLHKWVKKKNYSVAANGAVYRNDRKGIVPEILEDWFENRQKYKALRNEARERGDDEEAEYYDKQQHNRKILINCFTPDHEIVTHDGIKDIEDVEVGDEVPTLNTDTMQLEMSQISRTYCQEEYEGLIIEIRNDNVDFRVTPNHDMVVNKDGSVEKVQAKELVGTSFSIPGVQRVDVSENDIQEVRYQGKIVCVEVEDNHTILAGRNGKFNWTGQSIYGVLGLPVFRFYDLDNASAVTLTGQSTIKFTAEMGDHYYGKRAGPNITFEDGSESKLNANETYTVIRDGEKKKVKGKNIEEGDELVIES